MSKNMMLSLRGVRFSKKQMDLVLEQNKKRKQKIARKVFDPKKYGTLEFEDALEYLLRRKVGDFNIKFNIPKKNIKTPTSPKNRNMVSLEYEDLMLIARRRRNRIRQNRIRQINFFNAPSPPREVIHRSIPKINFGPYFLVGLSQMQGRRPYMEDASNFFIENLKFSFFGVYDGHIGYKASHFVKDRLIKIIKEKIKNKKIEFVKPKIEKTELKQKKPKERLPIIIHDSFLQVQNELVEKKIFEGTCASIILLRKFRLFSANVGDSKTILFKKNGEFVQLTEDHDTKNVNEIERIKKMGGKVHGSRVNGLLNITRSLGDSFSDVIAHYPYMRNIKLNFKTDKFIVIASDGLWNYVSPKEVGEVLKKEKDPRIAAQTLRDLAFSKYSTDNISVLVIKFDKKIGEKMKEDEKKRKLKRKSKNYIKGIDSPRDSPRKEWKKKFSFLKPPTFPKWKERLSFTKTK